VVVATEIQDSQTAKEAFGSDAVADILGVADATNTAAITASGIYEVPETNLFEEAKPRSHRAK
jgi:hypothetical protein